MHTKGAQSVENPSCSIFLERTMRSAARDFFALEKISARNEF